LKKDLQQSITGCRILVLSYRYELLALFNLWLFNVHTINIKQLTYMYIHVLTQSWNTKVSVWYNT